MGRICRAALALSAVVAATAAGLPANRSEPPPPPDRSDTAASALSDLRESSPGPVEVRRDPTTGLVTSLGTRPGRPIPLDATTSAAATAEFTDRYGAALGAAGTELVPTTTTERLTTGTTVRLQQEVGGVPVLGGEATLQLDGSGDVDSVLADLSEAARSVDVEPTVPASRASEQALAVAARDTASDPEDLAASAPEAWIYDPVVMGSPDPGPARLTWRVSVAGPGVRQLVLIDAQRGGAALSLSTVANALQRSVCDNNNVNPGDKVCAPGPYARTETGPASGVADVNAAYHHMGSTWTFFHDRFGRDSLDGDGLPLRATVRYCTPTHACPYTNAFWQGPNFDAANHPNEEQITLGAGFVSDDVVAHELTHGVVEYTAGLFTWYQSGAINESMADVFGEFVDQTNGTGTDTSAVRWQIGEDLPGGYLRNMRDPTVKGDPDSMTSPLYDGQSGDAGGTHSNSGVGNRAAALMTDGGTVGPITVNGLGLSKVAAIYYETLTALLTSASDYADLAVALPQACLNLVGQLGIKIIDCQEVQDAVDAVAMTADPPVAAAPEAPVCPDGIEAADLFFDDFETTDGTWTRTTTAGWAWTNPAPSYSRYATSGTQNLWGADTGVPQDAPTTPANFGDASIGFTDPVAIPANTQAWFRFRHAFGFERLSGVNRDGGVVEYSTNGNSWNDMAPLFTDNGYNGTLDASSTTNPLNGRSAFVDESHGYISSRADLSSLANRNVRIRFRLGEDAAGGDFGWYIDDVQLYLCPDADLTVTQTTTQPTVTVGDDIDIRLRIANTGNLPLTGISVTDPEAPDCEGQVANIAVGATRDVTCTYRTVDPDDIGTYTNTATVSVDERPGTTASNTVSIPVLAPGTPMVSLEQEADQTTVAVGEAIDLHLTVNNTGNVPLSGITITDANAPTCAGPVTLPGGATELAVGARHTVDCSYTPTEVGTFVNTASVTTNQLTTPTPANEVSVDVRDETDPEVVITAPVNGSVVNQGQVLAAKYECTDDQPGVDCAAPTDDGQPINTSTPGTFTFTVTGTDTAGNETVVTHTYTVANRRPDARIRQGAAGLTVGDNRYNLTGAGQNRMTRVARGASVTYYVTIQNDGTHPEAFRLRGQPSTTRYSVRYLSGTVDITAKARNGTYQTPVIAPGAVRTIRVVVTVSRSAPAGSQVNRLVTISSASNPLKKDAVRFIVKRA